MADSSANVKSYSLTMKHTSHPVAWWPESAVTEPLMAVPPHRD